MLEAFPTGGGRASSGGHLLKVTQEGGHSPGWGSSAGRAVEGRKKEKGDSSAEESFSILL